MARRTIHWTVTDTAIAPVLLGATRRGICYLSFDTQVAALKHRFPQARWLKDGDYACLLVHPVRAALADPRKPHTLPLDLEGTPFQLRVWEQLRAIPGGETRSYGELAAGLGDAKASRAVGTANGANPVAVLVPCHRVIAADGSLGGHAGGLERKRDLLEREGAACVAHLGKQAELAL